MTQFIGALHDTTRDEIEFYDEKFLSDKNKVLHQVNVSTFNEAVDYNAKERSRRFVLMNAKQNHQFFVQNLALSLIMLLIHYVS